MVKFSWEYKANMIPEWRDAFVDYKCLKKLIKRIKISRPPLPLVVRAEEGGFSICDLGHALIKCFSTKPASSFVDGRVVDEESLQLDLGGLVQSTNKHERVFLEKADEELEKTNGFYARKEADLLARGEALIGQLRILFHDHASPPPSVDGSSGEHILSGLASPDAMADDGSVPVPEQAEMAALERGGVSFAGAGVGLAKEKDCGLPLPEIVRIDVPPPPSSGRTAASMAWEDDLVNDDLSKDAAAGSKKKTQYTENEKSIRDGFLALYRDLELLTKFSSLNAKAFTKILKKFIKVCGRHEAADLFSEKVKRSPFSSSDKVLKLADEVECIFTEHFAGNDREMAMKYLRPQEKPTRKAHTINFLTGLFTGTFVSLLIVYAVLAHVSGVFSSAGNAAYMEKVYHVFSIFALISLHVFLHGCNLFIWKRTRINHNFIFGFSPSTALRHQDAFLISASIMCTVAAALVVSLFSKNAGASYANASPGAILLLSTVVLFSAFSISYRSTLFCFMRVIRNIVFSPFYKVLMADFFMADQLTSQIPLLRHMEFIACHFMTARFSTDHPLETSTCSQQLDYAISFLPFYWRAMQCLRRYLEEGRDINELANAGKYASAIVAAAVRCKHAATPTPFWMGMVIASSSGATVYQLYWDFVKDWGLLDPKSKNPWLRDELVLKSKWIYYASMMLNLVLRLAWTESVMKVHVGTTEHRLLDFSLSCLEIIRRGHWNFYRLENEHLNNVGKFRAARTVPLPFRELETN